MRRWVLSHSHTHTFIYTRTGRGGSSTGALCTGLHTSYIKRNLNSKNIAELFCRRPINWKFVNSSELLQGCPWTYQQAKVCIFSPSPSKFSNVLSSDSEKIELMVFWAEMKLSYQSLQETHQLQGGPVIVYLKICQFPLLSEVPAKGAY